VRTVRLFGSTVQRISPGEKIGMDTGASLQQRQCDGGWGKGNLHCTFFKLAWSAGPPVSPYPSSLSLTPTPVVSSVITVPVRTHARSVSMHGSKEILPDRSGRPFRRAPWLSLGDCLRGSPRSSSKSSRQSLSIEVPSPGRSYRMVRDSRTSSAQQCT
jgi:hypothetical protein